MRVSSEIARLDIAPGNKADVTLDVVNTGSVIDGITARVVGLPERNVTTSPSVLPLFPDSAGRLTVTLGLPQSFPAGRHPMTVEVLSRQPDSFPAYVNVDLEVPRTPALGIASRPEVVRARRTARFIVTVTNRGNVLLDVDLKVNDPQKLCAVTTTPPLMTLPPGASAEAIVSVRAKRMILGADVDRALTVEALARPAAPPSAPTRAPSEPSLPADPAPPPDGDAEESGQADESLTEQVPITYRQRPYLTRGVITALILFAIIALWAGAFLFGLARVFAGDPLTKTAPASFFAATPADGQSSASATGPQTAAGDPLAGAAGAAAAPGAGAGGKAGTAGKAGAGAADPGSADPAGDAAANRAAPKAATAGAVPRSGALPAGVGGTLTGTVTAKSSGQPVGRILVEALRVKADGSTVTAASAASQSDGSYQISGLFPGSYLLRFSGSGFKTSYYPAASTPAKAQTLEATAGAVNPKGRAIVTGLPATITGTIDPGDTTQKVTTTVTARLLQQGSGTKVTIPKVTTNTGRYTIPDLPAPGSYQLTFSTPGYQVSTVETTVTGGAQRFESQVVLSAGTSKIKGLVTDGTKHLGGAKVTTTVNGQEITTGTPTSGRDVGHFVIGNLPTPATYVVTVSKPGYGRFSQVIDLAPNEQENDLKIVLRAGTGVVEGTVRDQNHAGIGGATVTVGGMADPPSTVTLTDGAVGSFRLTGLPTPGSYTLTFSLPGYTAQTVPIILKAGTVLPPQNVVMLRSVGTIAGVVTGPGNAGVAGVTVTATDGQRSWPVITTGNAAGNTVGSYALADIPAGVYTVTATDTSGTSRTALVTVSPGKTTPLNFRLPGGG